MKREGQKELSEWYMSTGKEPIAREEQAIQIIERGNRSAKQNRSTSINYWNTSGKYISSSLHSHVSRVGQ